MAFSLKPNVFPYLGTIFLLASPGGFTIMGIIPIGLAMR
jgi:hypothetical protein